jgi:hypothetical protein
MLKDKDREEETETEKGENKADIDHEKPKKHCNHFRFKNRFSPPNIKPKDPDANKTVLVTMFQFRREPITLKIPNRDDYTVSDMLTDLLAQFPNISYMPDICVELI